MFGTMGATQVRQHRENEGQRQPRGLGLQLTQIIEERKTSDVDNSIK